MEKGIRVYAIQDMSDTHVNLFGLGTYVGDEVPKDGEGGDFAKAIGMENPKIILDNGQVVWGCECWWGPEEEFEKIKGSKTVNTVDIAELRKSAQSAENS